MYSSICMLFLLCESQCISSLVILSFISVRQDSIEMKRFYFQACIGREVPSTFALLCCCYHPQDIIVMKRNTPFLSQEKRQREHACYFASLPSDRGMSLRKWISGVCMLNGLHAKYDRSSAHSSIGS